MPLVEDPELQRRLLTGDPIRHVELLDIVDRDPPGSLGLFVDDVERPGNLVASVWGGGVLAMTNEVHVLAQRVGGLDHLLDELPRGQGTYEFYAPWWVAPALNQIFKTETSGPVARYQLRSGSLRPHPAARQTVPFEDLELVRLAFPRLVPEAPHRALVLREALVAIAVTTAIAEGVALIGVHVPETHRGHGFGAGVVSALAADLLDRGLTPVALVPMASERAVRLFEGLGFLLHEVVMRAVAVGRLAPGGGAR